jgi:hypothetical protein
MEQEMKMKHSILGTGGAKKVVQSYSPKKEPVAKKASPAGISQMGVSVQFKREPIISGSGYTPAKMPSTGVPGYFNAAKQGPGSGRTIMRSGAQSHYGSNPPNAINTVRDVPATKPGRDILGDFGSDYRKPLK